MKLLNSRSLSPFLVVSLFAAAAGLACSPPSSGVSTGGKTGGTGGKKGQGGSGGEDNGNGGDSGENGTGGNGSRDGGLGFKGFADALSSVDGGGKTIDKEGQQDALEMCGEQKFAVSRELPEVVIVLDRSGSMVYTAAGGTASAMDPSRWTYTGNALRTVVGLTEADILWGMKMYPTCHMPGRPRTAAEKLVVYADSMLCDRPIDTHSPCATDGIERAPMQNSAAPFSTLLTAETPSASSGATPTRWAVQEAAASLMARNTPNPKFLLLATDGSPNCGLTGALRDDKIADFTGSEMAVKAAFDAGIPVFVLGIAIADPTTIAGLSVDDRNKLKLAHDSLNAMAVAGGRPRADAAVKYYPALNEKSLQDALSAIAAQTISCVFPLEMAPPDGAMTRVEVDGKTLKEDDTDGWSFTANQRAVRFNGQACAKLQSGEFKATQVLFGCPGKPLPPPPPPAL